MPIYQYQCDECHHQMEALQKMSDPKLVDCPECSASALKKQVTAAAFKLKGTGWYETDFKNSGAKPETASAKKPSETTSSAEGSSTDPKPKTETSIESSSTRPSSTVSSKDTSSPTP